MGSEGIEVMRLQSLCKSHCVYNCQSGIVCSEMKSENDDQKVVCFRKKTIMQLQEMTLRVI